MKNPLNNFPAHTEKEKAEIIANHFETQFKLNNFGTASTENTVSKSIEKFFTRSPTPTYEKVKASKIADYLKKIKKAPGIDNIANKMLKNLPLKIILKLANLYNYMFKLNHFPGCWKTARILPILKPGKDPTQPISYRPISLLLTLSKLSKKIILNRYIKHANKVRIPIPQQFGFTPQLSTTHQLLRVTEHILEGKSANLATATIFLDIAKAFDKHCPEIKIYNTPVPWKKEIKYLGVILDRNLTFRPHLNHIKDKYNKAFRAQYSLICRNSRLSIQNKLLIYQAYLRPILTYASPVWAFTAKSNFNIIQVLENKTIRMIMQADWYIRNVDIRKSTNIPSLKNFIIKLSDKFYNNLSQIDNTAISKIPSYDSSHEKFRKRPRAILCT
ncbi:RNA-directed DNA polymerase from mobile element jockey [Araneus ventricosus]|uniref:RNA-directed DNA polymerase from mobile element jockey n=1 Tax=Araneus ventricosus TaxID=182803 RepID=A0A4Y2GGL9_ARAVE|nr:RNA-directed DNA polymerase from mobile element jockey [Araneus ventricosus]